MKKLLLTLLFSFFCISAFAVEGMFTVENTTDLNSTNPVGTMTYVNSTDTIYINKANGYEVLGNKTMAGHIVQYDHTAIGLPAGISVIIFSGSCPSGWTEDTVHSNYALMLTNTTNADIGTTVGSNTITPTGNITWTGDIKTLTGNLTSPTVTINAFTPTGNINAPVWTGDAKVLTGNSTKVLTMDAMATHIHTYGTIAVATHTVVATKQGTATGNVVTTATHTVSGSTQAITAGTPTGNLTTTPLTMNSYTPTGNNTAPAFTGTPGTPTGNLTSPTLTINPYTPTGNGTYTGDEFDNRQASIRVIICTKD